MTWRRHDPNYRLRIRSDLTILDLRIHPLLPLPLQRLHHLWRTILDQLARFVDFGPLWDAVRDVHHPLAIEDVASGTQKLALPSRLTEPTPHHTRPDSSGPGAICRVGLDRQTYLGLKLSFASCVSKWIKLGNSNIIFRPSSMMGEWQKLQRTLQGSWCSVDLDVGSYHSRSWWPCEKLMSSLWKMAAHWKGAAAHKTCCQQQLMFFGSSSVMGRDRAGPCL